MLIEDNQSWLEVVERALSIREEGTANKGLCFYELRRVCGTFGEDFSRKQRGGFYLRGNGSGDEPLPQYKQNGCRRPNQSAAEHYSRHLCIIVMQNNDEPPFLQAAFYSSRLALRQRTFTNR
jgi:hypothetical protein